MSDDIADYKGKLPTDVKNPGLDEKAMKHWWNNYQEKFSLWNNCSHVTTDALEVGGMDMPNYLIHDPEQVFKAVNKALSNLQPKYDLSNFLKVVR